MRRRETSRRPDVLGVANVVVAWLGGRTRQVIALAIVVGAVLLLGYVVVASRSGDTAASGTTVGGVDIGGMSRTQAEQAVADGLGTLATKRIRVSAGEQVYVVKPPTAGLGLDASASVEPAFSSTWNPFVLLGRMTGGNAWPAVPAVDDDALSAQVATIAEAVDVAPVEPVLAFEGRTPELTKGKPGRALDQDALRTALVDALLVPRSPVPATIATIDPDVSADEQGRAMAYARAAVSGPVVVHAEDVSATLEPAAIARALSFSEVDGAFVPSLDGAVLHKAIADELKPIESPGRDATFKIRHGSPKVVPSKVGQGVSDDELATSVLGVLDADGSAREVTVTVGVREPALTTQAAEELGVTEKLSSFTQNFPYAAYRVQNIGEAARRINGTILMPGETFSMNDTIKERTEANGYTEGFVIGEGGVFQEALGGGVSTATTAVWTAAFYAGLERVQTVAHSIYISRYKPGLEATVAWGIFDMKFRNDTPHAVFIKSWISNTSITVSMWGTKVYDDIEADYGARTDVRPFDTVYDKSKTCLGQAGVDGFTITVTRDFITDGETVRTEPIRTVYKPAPEVICGKKPKPEDAEGDPSASPSPDASGSAAPSGSGKPTASPSPSAQPSSSAKPSGKPSAKPSRQ